MNKYTDFYNNNEINKRVKKYLEKEVEFNEDYKYAYFIMNKSDPYNVFVMGNHQDWFDLYLKLNYQLIDPVVIKSLSRVSDFFCDDQLILSSKLSLPRVMAQARDFSIVQGHSFVLHDHLQNIVILSIYIDDITKKFKINTSFAPIKNALFLSLIQHNI